MEAEFILDLIFTEFLIKKNMKKVKIILILIIGTLIVSCNSNTYDEIAPKLTANEVITNPTYEKNLKQVVATNCLACHGATGQMQYPPLTNYSEVKDAIENGSFICRIDGTCGQIMPQSGRMPQATIDLIKLWKDQGYVN